MWLTLDFALLCKTVCYFAINERDYISAHEYSSAIEALLKPPQNAPRWSLLQQDESCLAGAISLSEIGVVPCDATVK